MSSTVCSDRVVLDGDIRRHTRLPRRQPIADSPANSTHERANGILHRRPFLESPRASRSAEGTDHAPNLDGPITINTASSMVLHHDRFHPNSAQTDSVPAVFDGLWAYWRTARARFSRTSPSAAGSRPPLAASTPRAAPFDRLCRTPPFARPYDPHGTCPFRMTDAHRPIAGRRASPTSCVTASWFRPRCSPWRGPLCR